MNRGALHLTLNVDFFTDNAADDYVRAVEDHTDFSAATMKQNGTFDLTANCDVIVASHENFLSALSSGKFGNDIRLSVVTNDCNENSLQVRTISVF